LVAEVEVDGAILGTLRAIVIVNTLIERIDRRVIVTDGTDVIGDYVSHDEDVPRMARSDERLEIVRSSKMFVNCEKILLNTIDTIKIRGEPSGGQRRERARERSRERKVERKLLSERNSCPRYKND